MWLLYLEPVWWAIPAWVEFFPALQVYIAVPENILIRWGLITGRTMSVLGWGRTMSQFFRRAFSECTVAGFMVRLDTWVGSSLIVLVNSKSKFLPDCVTVAIFASTRVWSCYISVNSAACACADCTFSTYPLFFEVLYYLRVSLNALARWALKLLQVFSSLGFRDHSWQSSWYSPYIFDVCVRHRDNMSRCIRILHRRVMLAM